MKNSEASIWEPSPQATMNLLKKKTTLLMPPLIGDQKEPLPPSKIKDNVDLAGPSPLPEPLKVTLKSPKEDYKASPKVN